MIFECIFHRFAKRHFLMDDLAGNNHHQVLKGAIIRNRMKSYIGNFYCAQSCLRNNLEFCLILLIHSSIFRKSCRWNRVLI